MHELLGLYLQPSHLCKQVTLREQCKVKVVLLDLSFFVHAPNIFVLNIPKPYYELLLNSESKYIVHMNVVETLSLELFLSLKSDL